MRKVAIEALFRMMVFCPMCGGELERLGGLTSEFKSCIKGCGVMSLKGTRNNANVGMFLEIAVENLPA